MSARDASDTRTTAPLEDREVAYFSMEVAVEPYARTYAGGLGVLAGDTLRAAADLELPIVGVSLVYHLGHFRQSLTEDGRQHEGPEPWNPAEHLERAGPVVSVHIEGREVAVGGWIHRVRGESGYTVPVVFLDTRLPQNDEEAQSFTDMLYGGDMRYRLAQEIVLGLGGVLMLRALGAGRLGVFHMNEGHSALLGLALSTEATGTAEERLEAVRHRCVFTTHTPVPAGHDQFPRDLATRMLAASAVEALDALGCCLDDTLNMTYLGLKFSRYVNGVAMHHSELSRGMFPGYPVASITNGVHAGTWTSPPFRALFDRHISDWRLQNDNLRYAVGIPLHEIAAAHVESKRRLIDTVAERTGITLNPKTLTLGFARRATAYKRADLLFSDVERLRAIASNTPLQLVFAGKAHPRDDAGKAIIQRIVELGHTLDGLVKLVYLDDYDTTLGSILCAGADVWLNTPQPPHEASGTSGMKAALNGVPQLSVLDGWWIEGHVEGVTGWTIESGTPADRPEAHAAELRSLYEKLEKIANLYYGNPERFTTVGRHAIALNGSFFNAERMLQQYVQSAYRMRATARDEA